MKTATDLLTAAQGARLRADAPAKKFLPDLMLTSAARLLLAREERLSEFAQYVLTHRQRLDARTLHVLQRDIREAPGQFAWRHPDDEPLPPPPTAMRLLLDLTVGDTPDRAFPDPEDWLVLAAFRYCLGRQTYVSGDCAVWLEAIWGALAEDTRETITRETRAAIEAGTAGNPNIDVPYWQALLNRTAAA